MIQPTEDREDVELPTPIELRAASDRFFAPGGLLEEACASSPFPYEHRPQQRQMAEAVSAALEQGRPLAVEAGTGVGKSFAYLVPAILAIRARGAKAVVATYTISLQEQLMAKDIPFLRRHLGVDFKAVLVKGRGNYLCLRRLARAERMGGDLFARGELSWVDRIRSWSREAGDGSMQELHEQPPPGVWTSVCAEEGNCSGQKCPEYHSCFFMRARRQAAGADLLVVNHHLLFADLALRLQEAALLPDYATLVFDEAHQMENVASEHLGLRLSHYAFEHWMKRLYQPDSQKGLLANLREGEAAHAVQRLADEVAELFSRLRETARFVGEQTQRTLTSPPAIETPVPARLAEIAGALQTVMDKLEDDDLVAELRQARRRGLEMREQVLAFLEQRLDDHVYWLEAEGRRRLLTMYSAPIEVGPALREALFAAVPCVIMTSATLAVNGSLEYFTHRVGAEACATLAVGSPFDYARQMKVWIPVDMPDPADDARFVPAAASAVEYFTAHSDGAAFVLFTSSAMMRRVADRVREPLAGRGLRLLVQGEGLPRHRMLEEFRRGEGTVLFGLDSFWMGVDVPGDALTNVIIVRLPFSVPDQPLVRARMDRIKQKGGDPFREYSLPEAVIKFRQGVGRLIRTQTDEGVVVVLDRRITGKWYGRWFLRSIPECPVEFVEVPGLAVDRPDESFEEGAEAPPDDVDGDVPPGPRRPGRGRKPGS